MEIAESQTSDFHKTLFYKYKIKLTVKKISSVQRNHELQLATSIVVVRLTRNFMRFPKRKSVNRFCKVADCLWLVKKFRMISELIRLILNFQYLTII